MGDKEKKEAGAAKGGKSKGKSNEEKKGASRGKGKKKVIDPPRFDGTNQLHIIEFLKKKFDLVKTISETNIVLWTEKGVLKRYSSPEEVLHDFCTVRLKYYLLRQKTQISIKEEDILKLENKLRFLRAIKSREINIEQQTQDIVKQLVEKKFNQFFPKGKNGNKKKRPDDDDNSDDEENGEEKEEEEKDDEKKGKKDELGYKYLLTQMVWNLTIDKLAKIEDEIAKKKLELAKLSATNIKDTWKDELANFLKKLVEFEADVVEYWKSPPKKIFSRKKTTKATKKQQPRKSGNKKTKN
jgi:DNA topoisomerase-2